MSRKNNSAIIFAICYVLFSLGLNGSDLGLPQYITFNRIAYILIGFTGFFL